MQDSTSTVLKSWQHRLEQEGIKVVIGGSDGDVGKGNTPKGGKIRREFVHFDDGINDD